MEVSNQKLEPDGQELIEKVVSLTGLPEAWIRQELNQILEKSGQSSKDEVTLDQLREAMLAYLEAIQEDLETEKPALST